MLSPEELSALYLSAKVASVATLFCLPFAICLGWMLARYEFRSKFLIEAMLQLPMVLPPVVLGYVLLVLFSPQGWIGQVLAHWALSWRLTGKAQYWLPCWWRFPCWFNRFVCLFKC